MVTALLGRDDEFDLACRAIYAAGLGTPVAVLVEGEPGAGKTALIEEIAAQAALEKFRIVRVQQPTRERVIDAIAALHATPPGIPVCLIVDEAHRGDTSAAAALGRLLDESSGRALLLLIGSGMPRGPLPRSLTDRFAAGLAGVRVPLRPLPDAVLAPVSHSSRGGSYGGNPGWAIAAAAGRADVGDPGPRLTRAVHGLVEDLAVDDRRILRLLAHAESPLHSTAIADALDGTPSVKRAAQTLGLLIDDGAGGIRLASGLVRRVVQSVTPPDEARHLHRALASVTTGRTRLHHLVAAVEPGGDAELAEELEEESTRSLRRGDYEDAALFGVYAARASTEPSDYERRLLDAGTIIGLSEELALAHTLGTDVAALPPGPTRELLVAGLAYFAGHYPAAEGALEALLAAPDGDRALHGTGRRVAWLILSTVRAVTGKAAAALVAAREASLVDVSADERITPLLDRVLGMQLATTQWANGSVPDALRTLERLLDQPSSVVEHTDAVLLRGAINYYGGQLAAARADITRGLRSATPDHAVLRRRLSEQAVIDFHCGEWPRAQQYARDVVEVGRRERDPRGVPPARAVLAMILTARGSHETAREHLDAARASPQRPSLFVQLHLVTAEAWIARERDDAAAALRITSALTDSSLRSWSERIGLFSWHALAVGALIDTGALAAAEAALSDFDRLVRARPAVPLVHGHPAWLHGRLAEADGDLDRARRSFEAAQRLSAGTPYALALVRRSAGALAARQARAADAKEHFAAARTLLLTLGASAAAARIDAVAEFPEALEGLSPREREVARLVSRGRTNQQIAEELIVSIKTVEFHVSRILRKLSLTSRRQLFDMSELSRMT
jgi:DNA-binding CsgD family transcriptional regulator